jgi:hypothetical protein
MKTIVGVFDNDQDAEKALMQLDHHGFGRDHVEMVATDAYNESVDRDADVVPHREAAEADQRRTDSYLDDDDRGALPFGGVIPAAAPGHLAGTGAGPAGSATGGGTAGFIPVPLAAGAGAGLRGRLIELGVDEDDADFYARAARKNDVNGILLVVKAEDEQAADVIKIMRDANGVTQEPGLLND